MAQVICFRIKTFHRRRRRKLISHRESTVIVSIYDNATSKIAMLWSPENNWDNDIISADLAKRLGAKIEKRQNEVSSVDFMGKTLEIKGRVLLEWGVERSKQVHTTEFLVATSESSLFEIVLGRRHAVEYGLLQS